MNHIANRNGGLIGSLEAMRRRETSLAEENEAIEAVLDVLRAASHLLRQVESAEEADQFDTGWLRRSLQTAGLPASLE